MVAINRRGVLGLGAGVATAAFAGGFRPARAADPVEVRVGFIPVTGAAQLFVFDGLGWAKERGLSLKLTQFASGPNLIQAVASGGIDAYYAGVGPLIVARQKGIGVKVVAATAVEEVAVLANGALAEAVAKAGGDIPKAFAALAKELGRPVKLATQPKGSVPQTVLLYWVRKVAKIDEATVEVVPLGIEETQQALLAGGVEGASIREPAITVVQERNPAIKILVTGGQILPNQPGTVLGLTEKFIAEQPAAAQTLVDLTVKATELLKSEPKTAAPLVNAVLGKGLLSVETIEKALVSPGSKFTADPESIVQATGILQDFQLEIGTIDKTSDLSQLFDASFYKKAVAK
ncbi:ABC transporter substrate-binding protein [Zavarzinia sp.]|uniref:ABC transporter substrate-binding protein n=1 Tax=Zavarzinia sp. TaxID=2027920 RepID=UPI0035694895